MRSAEGRAFLADILDAVITATGADFGNIQLVNPLTGALEIVAHKGFRPDFLFSVTLPAHGDIAHRREVARSG